MSLEFLNSNVIRIFFFSYIPQHWKGEREEQMKGGVYYYYFFYVMWVGFLFFYFYFNSNRG